MLGNVVVVLCNGVQVEEGATIAVFGLGGVGLGVIQGARIANAGRIIAVDVNPSKAGLAMEFGATDFVNPADYPGQSIQVGLRWRCEVAVLPTTLHKY